LHYVPGKVASLDEHKRLSQSAMTAMGIRLNRWDIIFASGYTDFTTGGALAALISGVEAGRVGLTIGATARSSVGLSGTSRMASS
jgi:hypothetical protein